MRTRLPKGFTLVEVLVTIGIIGLVAGITVNSLSKVRGSVRATQCVANQKQISHALQLFYNDHRVFPSDGEDVSLRLSLKDYIRDEGVFRCPQDPNPAATDSYRPYYVRRFRTDGEVMFTLGCPRHKNSECAASLFDNGAASLVDLGKVDINGQEVFQDADETYRTIDSGKMTFEDQSTVEVIDAQADYSVTVVESFRLGDGTLYTVVRVKGDGKIDCAVTAGSKFEVVTPSAVVGVRGTRFTVETKSAGAETEFQVTSGSVWIRDRVKGATRVLNQGQSATCVDPDPGCVHCPQHCKGTKHCLDSCPLHPDGAVLAAASGSGGGGGNAGGGGALDAFALATIVTLVCIGAHRPVRRAR